MSSKKRIGPVVPAIVATVTDPSIPSNAPVPPMIVPGNGGGRGGASNVNGTPGDVASLFKATPFPKLKTKAEPE